MKAVIMYDSAYGNTKSVAEAIAAGLENSRTVPVSQFRSSDVSVGDLLVVGSPINGWRPTEAVTKALDAAGADGLAGVLAAAFDTRVKLFIHGDAAKKISHGLQKAGATLVAQPMPFYVKGTEGPLLEGEIKRAFSWSHELAASVKALASRKGTS
ncbi:MULTISPECIES: flavodoxin domain-containing protein [Paenarthrobacter]|uniref:flavodoxin family protein n=1 Tax=Paenarthrobacter TaxID=1742992 RepID=UPI00074D373F|nr:flavodoxin domain-containing protein [Paenarthrobacter ureafaciens]AMB40398.1 flavodoxin [Arthrobacter sp. ATCC 21022]KUR65063.1 flavodoxin [Arthrobacter sp. ATCC 21022]RWX00138.1 flavodoxin [Paenarthrobacter ureafaciens]